MTSGITFAGEYILEEFSILKADSDLAVDIRNQLSGFYIYEDMFAPFMSGTAVIRDTLDLINLFGRGGKNLIRIKVTTPSLGSIEGFFHLYKISDRSITAERTAVYTLNFVSLESLTDSSLHISKRFTGNPSDIANELYTKHLKTEKRVITSPSSNKVAFVANYWSAIKGLVFLTDNAVSDKGASDYVAFENRDGFNFMSIASIHTQPAIQDFINTNYVMTQRREGSSEVVRDINLEYRQIQNISVQNVYDFMRDIESGAIRNRVLLHDVVRKQYRVEDYEQTKDVRSLLNKNRLYTDKVIETVRTKIMTVRMQTGLFESGDLSNARFASKRVMHMAMSRGQQVEIDVMGRTDYTVGKKITLELNQIKNITQDMDESEIRDNMLSGNYITTAVRHKFDGKSHTCKIEAMKDSTDSE